MKLNHDEDIDVFAMMEAKNNEIREYLANAEKSMKIPRKIINIINQSLNKYLMGLVQEFNPENGCCFLVKNISSETNVCFVHKITEAERTFENIELSAIPNGTKEGDVLVYSDGKLAVSPFVTCEVLKIRERIVKSLENSEADFQIEGQVYVVCDKSDDDIKPRFSLRTVDGEKEFWGIDITPELHAQIQYGSKVKYENGNYILA